MIPSIPVSAQAPTARAGEVRALVPTGYLLRSGTPQREAQRNDSVLWQDVLRTNRGGRMRVVLLDGSILNVGSESQLQIVEHDPAAERTRIQLAYGRMRASVTRLAKPDATFEVRSVVAVAGVVGTRFIVNALADFVEVFALAGSVRVTNADPAVGGAVILSAGEFTRVTRGEPPTLAAPASPEQLREAEQETDVPAGELAWSRAEVSWPPANCGKGISLMVRAWSKQAQAGKEIEKPVDSQLIYGRLSLGTETLEVEGGRAVLAGWPSRTAPQGSFMPEGGASAIPAKIWESKEFAEGQGWRAPRAVFAGSAFYVLGPLGNAKPEFRFGGQAAGLLWQGPCGAGFLAPMDAGREYEVTLLLNGAAVARGKMNLISVAYRMPIPPMVVKGQQSRFGIDISGLENLTAFTQGRPVMITIVTNQTPTVIGNLKSTTPGATVQGETITYLVGAPSLPSGPASSGAESMGALAIRRARQISQISGGTAKLEAVGTGRMAGEFQFGVDNLLDTALDQPRTPLVPVK